MASRASKKLDILQGILDVMVLQTLSTMGPQHGYGIARRIEQVSGDQVLLNQGTIYASLVRLVQRGWIKSKWGTSENGRKAKFYTITRTGTKRLAEEVDEWRRLTDVMQRVGKQRTTCCKFNVFQQVALASHGADAHSIAVDSDAVECIDTIQIDDVRRRDVPEIHHWQ